MGGGGIYSTVVGDELVEYTTVDKERSERETMDELKEASLLDYICLYRNFTG